MLVLVTQTDPKEKARAKDASAESEATSESGKRKKKTKKKAPRKERVLHTRVPEVLEVELKRTAQALRVPVSNLVRTILEDAVSAAQAVGRAAEDELRGAADRLGHERDRWTVGANTAGANVGKAKSELPVEEAEPREAEAPAPDPLEGVIGFQPLVLAVKTSCSKCGKPLDPGSEALLGVRAEPGPRIIVGPECAPGGDTE